MYSTKIIYISKDKKKYELVLPIIFSTEVSFPYTIVIVNGTTAQFSNSKVNGNMLNVSGITVTDNTLITKGGI